MDLSTTYLGLELRSPLVASSGPLTGRIDSLRRLEDAGIAAVVLPSLFEEQVVHDELQTAQLLGLGAATATPRRRATSPTSPTSRPSRSGTSGTSRRPSAPSTSR